MNKSIHIYSIYSGLCYEIEESLFNLLDDGQLPLLQAPVYCNKCYKRGYVGFSSAEHKYFPCKCIQKIADNNRIKQKFNI